MNTPTKEEQQARWDNAVRWAARINEALGRGYLVVLDGEHVVAPLEIDTADGTIHRPLGGRSRVLIFENDPDFDHGLHETPEEFNAAHEVRFYQPAPVDF